MSPCYGWGSTVSRLQSHYEETVYFGGHHLKGVLASLCFMILTTVYSVNCRNNIRILRIISLIIQCMHFCHIDIGQNVLWKDISIQLDIPQGQDLKCQKCFIMRTKQQKVLMFSFAEAFRCSYRPQYQECSFENDKASAK